MTTEPYDNKNQCGHPEFYKLLAHLAVLHNNKNRDYSGGDTNNPLGNFHRVAALKQLYPGFRWDTPFGTAMDFMFKQLDAALILYSRGAASVTGEPVSGRLIDVAVYALLGVILFEEEK